MQGRSASFLPSLLFVSFIRVATAEVVPFLNQGFSFNYYGPGETEAIPVTSQCDTLKLKWGRADKTGPAPVAPYFLQVLSSSLSTPLVIPAGFGPTFEWQVTFAPRTQYQICMWDTFGVSGGCQAMYTVVPSSTNATCEAVTGPEPIRTTISPLSPPGTQPQVPVIEQCSDLSVRPRSGSPPFTLTVLPGSHPPVNITSDSLNPISWTVALPEGFPFFLSLTSADGLSWSDGPLRARSGGTECLAPRSVSKQTFTFATVGSSVGSFLFGICIGILSCFLFYRRKNHTRRQSLRTLPSVSKPEALRSLISSPSGLPLSTPSRLPTPPISYPPPASLPNTPSGTPENQTFSHRTALRRSHSIEPFAVNSESSLSPTSSHFPLDSKRRVAERDRQRSLQHMRASSFTTQASSSQLTTVSSSNSNAPLLPQSQSRRTSRSSRLTRAPTYVRNAPSTQLSVSELITDDASLIGGHVRDDLPPQYMRDPREEEISVAGGRLI